MSSPRVGTDELPPDAIEHLQKGKKIQAIKVVRVTHEVGLKEAKERVEGYLENHPDLESTLAARRVEVKSGFARWFFIAVCLAIVAYWLLEAT